MYICLHDLVCVCLCVCVCVRAARLEGVEARLQETSEAFEKSRDAAKKSKIEYERVKKMRYDCRRAVPLMKEFDLKV